MSDTPHWRDLLRDRDTLMNAVYPDGMFPDYSDGVNVTLADGSSTHYAHVRYSWNPEDGTQLHLSHEPFGD